MHPPLGESVDRFGAEGPRTAALVEVDAEGAEPRSVRAAGDGSITRPTHRGPARCWDAAGRRFRGAVVMNGQGDQDVLGAGDWG